MRLLKKCIIVVLIIAAVLAMTGCEEDPQADDRWWQCVVFRRAHHRDVPKQDTKDDAADAKTDASTDAADTKTDGSAAAVFPDLKSFSADTFDGKTFSQKDLAKYDLTAINIWATTCPPCIDEMPKLAALAAKLPDNVNFITWCLDGDAQRETADDILKKSGFENTSLTTGSGDLDKLYEELMYTPTTVFVDSEGHMVGEALIGSPKDTETVYKEYINKALTELGKDPVK